MSKAFLPNGMEANEAEYKEQPILEYNSNPYIQALPTIKSKENIIKSLVVNQPFDVSERDLDSSIRIHVIQRIYKVFQPLPIHIKVWNTINTLIRQGYIARNPFDKEYKRYVNEVGKQIINHSYDLNGKPNFRTTASCGLIIGYSGIGKSTITNLVISKIPQIICHNEYRGTHFNQIQLTWLKLEAPHNSSLKALTLQFFMKIDELLGTDNFKRYVSRNLSIDAMLPLMGKVAQNVNLGLLIIDELQNFNRVGVNQIMNYFVTLINSFGVPILFIGTPASYDIFQNELRIARRVTGNGEIIWNNMDNGNEFKLILKALWRYQWTEKQVPLTEELIDLVYDLTQGITDLVVKLLVNVQYMAITSGKEEITPEIILKVAKQEFRLMQPMIDAIRSKNIYKMQEFEDIRRIDFKSNTNNTVKTTWSTNPKNEDIKIKKSAEKTNIKKKILDESSMSEKDIRRIVYEGKITAKSPYEVLRESGYIDTAIYSKEDFSDDELLSSHV